MLAIYNTYFFHSFIENISPGTWHNVCLVFKIERRHWKCYLRFGVTVASLQNVKKMGGLLWNKTMEVG